MSRDTTFNDEVPLRAYGPVVPKGSRLVASLRRMRWPVWSDRSRWLAFFTPRPTPGDFTAWQADAAARAEIETERDQYEGMLKSVIQNSQALIYVKDLAGRYLLLNGPFERNFGVAEADMIGRTDVDLDPELEPIWRANDLKAREGVYQLEEWSDSPDGRYYYDSMKFPLFDRTGRMYATCGISLDVTHSRRTNLALAEARDVAVAATAAKSAFLATMSHEIRTPMNAVIGMSELLLDTDLDERQHEFLHTIRSSGDALLAVINDVLDFSKIEAGELHLNNEPFNLRDEVEATLDLVVGPAAAKGLDLVCYVADSCPSHVAGDAARLRQILVNLLANAVKFTAAGEVLLSVTSTPTVTGRLSVDISVTDSGIGISTEGLSKLFQSFSQVDDSTSRAYSGTGLGLAISQRLAEAMGGSIVVSSRLGEGATFTVTVMLDRCDDGPFAGPSGADADFTGTSVLLVDDNQTHLRILDLQLSTLQLTCTAISSPGQALAQVTGGLHYDVAVLDLNMPDMTGVDLARALRQAPGGTTKPIILLTGMGTQLPETDVDFAAVIAKPVKSATLRSALTSVLHHQDVGLETSGSPSAPLQVSPQLRVLLAEDNPVNQRVAQLMLGKLGHAVDTVDNGQAAIHAITASDYDVVLMDVQMPIMDGLEATRQIRQRVPTSAQPHIVAMTASALVEDKEACSTAGMDSYLPKPVRLQELTDALAHVGAAPGRSRAVGPQQKVVSSLNRPGGAG